MQAFLLSSVLSASDEVSALSLIRMNQYPRLGAIIFGEGIINSALSIVLFKTFLAAYISERALSIDGVHPDDQGYDKPRTSPFEEGVSVANVTLRYFPS